MKALKIVGIVVGVILILLAVAAAVILARFDKAWLKQELVSAVQQKYQRTLRIDGDLGLSFYPDIGVRLEKVALSEHQASSEFAAMESARVSVQLMPLLSKQLVVNRIELQGLKAQVVKRKDGSFNFDDLAGKGKEAAKPGAEPKGEKAAPGQFDIAGVVLENAAISFSDEAKGSTLRIEQLNLRTGHLANTATGDLELSANVVENKPAVKAGVVLKGKYRYDLAQQQYALEGLSLRLKGDALDFKDLDAELSAKNLVAGQEIRVEGLALGVKSQLKGEALDLRLDAPQLAIAGDKAGGASVTLNLKLVGTQRQLESKLELSGVEGSKTALRIAKLAAQWDLKQAALALRGNLSSPLTANLANLAIDLPKLSGEMEVEHPAMPMKHLKLPLNASLHADIEKSSAAGDLATRFDESAIQLKWQVARFAPLAVGFDLAVDKLNVDKYFPPAPPAAAAGSGGSGSGTTAAEAPLNLDFLKGLDLKGEARIGFLQAHNIKLGNLKADLRIADGRLDVSPLSANFYEGQINGALSVNANGNRIALRQALSNVSVNPLLRDVAQKDMLEGRGNINLDVTTAGASVGALKQALAGTASFNLKDGAVKGINLAKSLRELKAKLSGKQDAAVEASKTEKTDFSELAASFRIAGGVAHNDDLSLKSPFVRVGGAGDIDIGKSRIDYLAKVSVVGSAKGQGDLDALKGLTIPVHLSGPFDALTYKFEFGAIATDLLKQEAKKQLEQQLGKQLDKKGLGDALKGLLK